MASRVYSHTLSARKLAVLSLPGMLLSLLGGTGIGAERFLQISAELDIAAVSWRTNSEAAAHVIDGQTNKRTIAFVCTFGTNQWSLEGGFSRNGRDKWFFDGADLYESLRIVEPLPEDTGEGLPSLKELDSKMTIFIRSAPRGEVVGSDVTVNIPWLAFCSSAYLKRVGRIVPLPSALLGHTPNAYAFKDNTQTFEDELGLPSKMVLLTYEPFYATSVSNFAEEAHWKTKPALSSGFADGLVKFHYLVTESTNVSGWNVPLRFEFGDDIPQDFGYRMQSFRGTGKVLHIKESSAPEGVFDPSKQQHVVDWRNQ